MGGVTVFVSRCLAASRQWSHVDRIDTTASRVEEARFYRHV